MRDFLVSEYKFQVFKCFELHFFGKNDWLKTDDIHKSIS